MSEPIKVPVDDFGATLADAIIKVAGIMQTTKLTEDALVTLISDSSRVNKTDTRAVLRSMATLRSRYVK